MVRSLDVPRPTRRQLIGLAVIAAAVLVALAATLQPQEQLRRANAPGDAGVIGADPALFGDSMVGAEGAGGMAEPAPASRELAPADGGHLADDGTGSMLVPPALDAKIVRTASLELDIRRGRFEAAWGDVQAVATAHGGYILAATRSGAGDTARTGSITMRVPSERFEDAIERLRGVEDATVERLDVASQDVTQEYVDVRSRLRHDRAVEGRLLALLAEAEGVSEVLAVQARLDTVQQQIEVARGRLQYLDKLTELSTITIALRAPATADRDERTAGPLGEAFEQARERFVANVAAVVVWLGGALPALVMLAVAGVVARVAWRRNGAPRKTNPGDEQVFSE
jgi:hypothetical protein